MSIRQITSMITGTAGIDQVSNYAFTPKEMEVYLKGLTDRLKALDKLIDRHEKLYSSSRVTAAPLKLIEVNRRGRFTQTKPSAPITDDRFEIHVPNLKTLQKNYDVVDELHEKLDILDSMLNQVTYSMATVPNKAGLVRSIKTMSTAIKKKVDTALKFLAKVAKGKEPEVFADIVAEVKESLLSSLAGAYAKFTQQLYIHTTEDDGETTFWFTHYLTFEGLRYNEDGDTYQQYHVVFTGKVDSSGALTMYANTLLHFKTPGRFNPGQPIQDQESALRIVGNLMGADEFVVNMHRVALPVKEGDIDVKKMRNKDLIASLTVDSDKHTIEVKLNRKVRRAQYQTALEKILAELSGLLGPYVENTLLRPQTKVNGSQYIITFSLVPRDSGAVEDNKATVNAVNKLKQRLGLSDKQVRDIVRTLHK